MSGQMIPDVTLYNQQGEAVSLHEIKGTHTLVFFWLYDCSHCKQEIPVVKSLYERYKDKGLKIVSVCGKSGEEEAKQCWAFAGEMQMPTDWYLLNDPKRRSRFWSLLNVQSYPCLFLLDQQKHILYKQMGAAPQGILEQALGQYLP